MSPEKEQILIDHLDRVLAGQPSPETATLINSDQELAKEWRSILFALEGIREAGLHKQVSTVRKQYQREQAPVSKPAGGVVRSMYSNVIRVAACIFILMGAAVVYKYATVTSVGTYNEYYSSFDLNTSRGSGSQDLVEEAYRAKNWEKVMSLSAVQELKTNKTHFLSAMAAMELKKYAAAIESFKQLTAANAKSGDNYFQDEAEYYLALAFLANKETANALPLLKKIRNDKNHLFNQRAKEIAGVDMEILELKCCK